MPKSPAYILPLIVLAQFAGTSLWFAGNAILPDLEQHLQLGRSAIGNITSVIQLGFITGTFAFSLLAIADRFNPSMVFFISSLVAALANFCIVWLVKDVTGLMISRFITGFFLAGVYPVGMKIAADWYEKGLGKALGWLVGALVLGTALPHLLKGLDFQLSWKQVILFTTLFAGFGGLLILLTVKEGPYRKRAPSFNVQTLASIFQNRDFRSAAFGYFGHMWELYTFWAFVPVLLSLHHGAASINISLWSFIVIGIGCIGCIVGGYLSQKAGSAKIAWYSLLASGLCCLLFYFILKSSMLYFLLLMVVWGITVVADSPQFSALVAQTAPPTSRGTALTFVTCVGFAITIASIQLIDYLFSQLKTSSNASVFFLLSVGPLLGLIALYRLFRKKAKDE